MKERSMVCHAEREALGESEERVVDDFIYFSYLLVEVDLQRGISGYF